MKLLGRYPVETRAQVKTASRYFDDYYKRFAPVERVEFARGLAARSAQLGEDVSEKVAHYAYASPRSIEPAIRARSYILGGSADDELTALVKEAQHTSPYGVMQMLTHFDAHHHIRDYSRVPDPFDSVFMSEKTAQELSGEETWTSPTSERLTKSQFQNWVLPSSNHSSLLRQFDVNTAEGLCGPDGWQVFLSLPDPHKTIIARMVTDNVIPGNTGPGMSRFSVAGNVAEEQVYESAHERLTHIMGTGNGKK